MENKEIIQAGNALVEWCNSQDLHPADAAEVMSKVLAKIIVGLAAKSPIGTPRREDLNTVLDEFTLQLVHDVNDRIHALRPNR